MKTILITGASGGLGQKLCLFFANKGWNVVATMIDPVPKELENNDLVFPMTMDVTSTQSIDEAKRIILEKFDFIDVIVNNAGLGYRSFVELSEDKKIDTIVNVNWLGVVKVCRAFIPVFRKQKCGQFVNITSIAGLVNLPLGNFYHSTKQAVESFSECMSYELLPFNVSVSTVQFGNVDTGFQKNVAKCPESGIDSYDQLMKKIDEVLQKKNHKNKNLGNQILNKLYEIAEKPKSGFRKYTIGFDANFMRLLRRFLGYRLFSFVIKKAVVK